MKVSFKMLKLYCYESMVIVELRRPEGPPSGVPHSYGKQKETHELIFS